MKVTLAKNECKVIRENGDPKYYGMSGESKLLHHIKLELIKQGYDVIKKLMWKDGHMYGDDNLHYIRSRRYTENDWLFIYDNEYAIRAMTEDFNKGELSLAVDRGGVFNKEN
jgi:hypothetical protein